MIVILRHYKQEMENDYLLPKYVLKISGKIYHKLYLKK